MGAKPPVVPPEATRGGGPWGGLWGGPGGSDTPFWLGKSDTEKSSFPKRSKVEEKSMFWRIVKMKSNEELRFFNI